MRTFEAGLVLLNVLAVLLTLIQPPKAAWLGIAGTTVLVLAAHRLFEGFRYQMAVSYVAAAVLVLGVAAATVGKPLRARIPLAFRLIALVLSLVLLALTAALSYALPVLALPPPTGDSAVGTRYLSLVDERRLDPFLDGSTAKRELRLKVNYPAVPDDAKPASRYFDGSTELMQAFAAFYGLPRFAFDHFRLVETHSKVGLELSTAEPSYPVVLFSHGAGTSMEVETSQSEDLASHGYVVVNIDHTYVSAATAFPDHLVTADQATTDFETPEPAEIITQIMADDVRFVIDQLEQTNGGAIDASFRGRLDLGAIGVIGHSVGGAVAYNLAITDPRVKAAINLDGAVYTTPSSPTSIAPFLMLANDLYHVQAIQNRQSLADALDGTASGRADTKAVERRAADHDDARTRAEHDAAALADVLAASGNLYTIEGSDHMKFTDIGLYIGSGWLRRTMQIGGGTEPARCLEISEALTAAFFDHHLKGRAGVELGSVAGTQPELEQVQLSQRVLGSGRWKPARTSAWR